jgi:hypothetical protein
MATTSLYDLAVLNRADEYTGLIEDVTTLAPEFSIFAAHPRKGTYYETVKRTTLPTAQFRKVNAGVTPSKSTYKKEVKEMFLVDVQLQMDEAIWKADPGNVGSLWQLEAAGAIRASSILIGQQTWYGTSADASGFTGARGQLAYTVAAGGTSNSTSAYLCWMDAKEGCRYDVGMDGAFSITPPRVQTLADPNTAGNVFTAYVGNLNAWVGYNQMSNLASWAVTGITATLNQWLSDSYAATLVAQIPVARRSNLRWFINRTAESTLQRARSTVNIGILASTPTASYQPADAAGRPAFSPLPNQLAGYPITLTDSILNTETN